ncbi:histidinol-phosphate transaminase [Caulobacter sp. NIBR2454]|uniref:histidinol-phosphate transaminase n=1 Tax=Caulobacter sp. NIBR2454 TaxID=3015996 RepID=UPI0022B604B5|nr:histidinol-phosphate transaminase [Caulobacter sp. NIBR2454]
MIDRTAADRPIPKQGILDIAAYVGGKSKVEGVAHPVKLSSNENVLGCSPKAREAYVAAADRMHIYPDSRAEGLRAAIAGKYGLEPERLIFGDGSDELFTLLCQTYLEPGDNAVMGEHGFAAYPIAIRAAQAEARMAREPNHRMDVDAVLELVDERTRMVFVANPGNPTGTWISGEEVRRLHAALPASVVLVLDEAYSEFARSPDFECGHELARTARNIVVTHTFSKLHGLAALRVGWGYGPVEMIEAMDRIRPPFNTSIPAQEAAVAALADDEFQTRSIAHVEQWRDWLTQQLGGIGLEVGPSATNFILITFPTTPGKTAKDADAFLSSKGYILRVVAGYGLPDCLRLTIGLEEHNRAVADLLAQFMGADR